MTTNKTIFITATDTDVGKTLVSGLLLRYLQQNSIEAGYQKWVSTGDPETPADFATVSSLSGIVPDRTLLDLQIPYRFTVPASPHLAAELDNKEIEPANLIRAYQAMAARFAVLVVEGVGGLLVPLRRNLLLADLLAQLKPPTIIVSRSGLGTINHTLLTIEAMRAREIPIAGIIFTDDGEADKSIVQDNMITIAAMGKVEVLGHLPYCLEKRGLLEAFAPIGQKIIGLLRDIN